MLIIVVDSRAKLAANSSYIEKSPILLTNYTISVFSDVPLLSGNSTTETDSIEHLKTSYDVALYLQNSTQRVRAASQGNNGTETGSGTGKPIAYILHPILELQKTREYEEDLYEVNLNETFVQFLESSPDSKGHKALLQILNRDMTRVDREIYDLYLTRLR